MTDEVLTSETQAKAVLALMASDPLEASELQAWTELPAETVLLKADIDDIIRTIRALQDFSLYSLIALEIASPPSTVDAAAERLKASMSYMNSFMRRRIANEPSEDD